MSVLTERLRNVTYMDDAEILCARAADALEAAEAELARLEHQLQQAEEATSAAYKDAETAEAKLAAIDALHRGEYDVDPDSFTMGQKFCVTDDEEWPCRTHRILHPEEEL